MRVEGRVQRADATRERELVLAAQRGEPGARGQLVESFRPPIASVARLYRGARGVSREELMQEGVVGLLRAVDRYDATLGTPFWAYAAWWVRQAMQQVVAELTRPVVLSDRAVRQLARVRSAEREHMQCHHREPTLGQLAADTGMTRRQVEHLVAAERIPRGIDEPIGERSGGSFGELLPDPRAEDAYERIPNHVVTAALEGLLARLDRRERLIVRARYGLDGRERTLRELAGALGVSAERVRQIEWRALEKLREAMAA
jgi:RNA polymerase sigma factor (sigma-70 family)